MTSFLQPELLLALEPRRWWWLSQREVLRSAKGRPGRESVPVLSEFALALTVLAWRWGARRRRRCPGSPSMERAGSWL